MRVYGTLLRIGLQDATQYRIEGFIWFLFDVVPPLMMLAFWSSAYEGAAEIAGYSMSSMLAYTMGVMLLRNLVSSHVEWGIDYEVRQGILSNYLIRPISPWAFWLINDAAWRALRVVMVTPLLLAAIALLLPTLKPISLDLPTTLALITSLVLAYLLCFLMKLCVGFTSFWLTDVTGAATLYEIVVYVLGGVLIPIELLPDALQGFARLMPFQYVYAFPLTLMLGRIEGAALVGGLLTQAAWCVALLGLATALWRAGLWRYEAVGR